MPDRSAAPAREWLRGPGFDLGLSLGVLALALALGDVALAHPALFVGVLLADVWLLAYPHVASTYTRIAFDRGLQLFGGQHLAHVRRHPLRVTQQRADRRVVVDVHALFVAVRRGRGVVAPGWSGSRVAEHRPASSRGSE